MNKQEFDRLYLGVYECDPREKELLDRVKAYFVATDDVGMSEAYKQAQALKQWCGNMGYSKGDLNRAKVTVNKYTEIH
jgi:hypothetical protein